MRTSKLLDEAPPTHTVGRVLWLQELYYRPVARIVAAVVLLGVAAGAVWVTIGAVPEPSAATPAWDSDGLRPGGLAADNDNLSASARACGDALERMQLVVDETELFVEADTVQRSAFALALADARTNCSYAEYVAFEQRSLVEWTRGLGLDGWLEGA